MLRPALTLITSEAIGGSSENALKSAAAIELIHTFSLIHDDIMDDDDMRRGMPSGLTAAFGSTPSGSSRRCVTMSKSGSSMVCHYRA